VQLEGTHMSGRYDKAELLTALWRLSTDDERLPTSHGILDRALNECLDALPNPLKEGLSFGVTGVGLRCFELPDILLAAQEAMLTSEPNPTYLSSIVTLDEGRARQIAIANGLTSAQARDIGSRLLEKVHQVKERLSDQLSERSVA